MAAFLELRRNADQILVELEHLAKYKSILFIRIFIFFLISREAEYAREFENRAALAIQSVWRGYRVRSHNKFVIFRFNLLIINSYLQIFKSMCHDNSIMVASL
jgi:hypothetical protein